MNWRFSWIYRLGLIVLVVTLFCSVWANAQQVTNTASGSDSGTNTVSGKRPHVIEWQAMTFGLDKVGYLTQNNFLEQPLWKYAASGIYVLLAFVVVWLLDVIVNFWLKHAAKTKTQYDDIFLKLLRGPIKVVAFVVFLHIGVGIFDWPDQPKIFFSRALIIVVAISVAFVVLKMVDLMFHLARERVASPEDRLFASSLFPVMQRVTKVTLIIVAVILTAENLDIRITSLLAGLSIGGLALGLAAQDTVANIFGAVAILLDKPFHIGDRIKVEAVDGTVESIGLRSTRVRNLDGHHVTIPNKLMGNAIITNITRRPTIKTEMNLGLTYDTSVEKVKRATILLEEIFQASPKTSDLIISFNKFADSALNIFVVHTWNGTDGKEHFAAMQNFNLQIKQQFEAEKIEFAFPTRTVHVKTEAGK